MSSRMIVRVTPYAEVTPAKIAQAQLVDGSCCGKPRRGRFCSECGQPVAQRTTEKLIETVRLVDAGEQIGDCLAGMQFEDNGPHLWLPNESRQLPELPSFDPAYDDPEAVPMTAALVEDAMQAFRKSFAGALAQLGRIYGSEPVIRFGAVGYRR